MVRKHEQVSSNMMLLQNLWHHVLMTDVACNAHRAPCVTGIPNPFIFNGFHVQTWEINIKQIDSYERTVLCSSSCSRRVTVGGF